MSSCILNPSSRGIPSLLERRINSRRTRSRCGCPDFFLLYCTSPDITMISAPNCGLVMYSPTEVSQIRFFFHCTDWEMAAPSIGYLHLTGVGTRVTLPYVQQGTTTPPENWKLEMKPWRCAFLWGGRMVSKTNIR